MKTSTILFYKVKYSLKTLGLYFLIIFPIFLIFPYLMGDIITTINNSTPAIFMISIISTSEHRNQRLFFQFNVSRKTNFLTSCLELFITTFIILVVTTLMNEFLISVFDARSLNMGPQFTYLPLYFENSIFNFVTYQMRSFVIIALAGSFGLLLTQLILRYSWKVAAFSALGGFTIFAVLFLLVVVFLNGEPPGNYLQWLANPLVFAGVLSLINFIVLKIAKHINRNINVSRDDLLKKSSLRIN